MREEARAWVLLLSDAHRGEDREAFERWVAQDPAHRQVYDEVLAAYHASGVLRTSAIGRGRDLEAAFRRRSPIGRWGLAAGSAAALLLIGAYGLGLDLPGLRPVAVQAVVLSSGVAGRDVTLADGSKVSMAAASEVRIDLGPDRRLAEVRKGRVRLSIAPDSRPFEIVAARTSRRADGGVFDAAVVAGEGVITAAPGTGARAAVTGPASRAAAARPASGDARQVVEFDAEPLGRAVERINRLAMGPVIELGPGLSDLRVTGVFRPGDSRGIARSLALAFGLEVTGTPSGALVLTHRK